MKKKSTKKSGFTLLETIISMTVTMILLVGVFSGYMMIIRSTKDGETKQKANLIGKELVEKIKASSDDLIIKDGKIYLADNIPIDQVSKQGTIKIKKDGSITTSNEDCEYEVVVNLSEKTTESNNNINISSYENSEENSFVIGDNTIYLKNDYPLNEKNNFNITSNLKINIDKYGNGTLGFEGKETKYTDSMNMVLDVKYCKSNLNIDIINNSNNTLNLCILNSTYMSNGERNVDINNEKGSVNEYYRANSQAKRGALYNIIIDIYRKGNRNEKLFKSAFVKNIEIH